MSMRLTRKQLRGTLADSTGVFTAQVSAAVQEELKQRQVVLPQLPPQEEVVSQPTVDVLAWFKWGQHRLLVAAIRWSSGLSRSGFRLKPGLQRKIRRGQLALRVPSEIVFNTTPLCFSRNPIYMHAIERGNPWRLQGLRQVEQMQSPKHEHLLRAIRHFRKTTCET